MHSFIYRRFCKIPKVGGSLLKEEDFLVEEIISRRILTKHIRSMGGMKKIDGPYTVLRLTKKGLTTEEALRKIAKKYGIPKGDIGFAGLKDKFAVTKQYITIKKSVSEFSEDGIILEVIGKSQNALSPGDLEGNRFEIVLHGCKNPENLEKILSGLEKNGMPNYFGRQRFGIHGDNHIIGKYLVKKEWEKARELINRNESHADLSSMGKRRLKFYVNSYQSYIFNRMLEIYLGKGKWKPTCKDVPILGLGTKKVGNSTFGRILREIIKKEGITEKSFRLDELRLSCGGGSRPAFVMPRIEKKETTGQDLKLVFTLPKGSYATILLEELGYEK